MQEHISICLLSACSSQKQLTFPSTSPTRISILVSASSSSSFCVTCPAPPAAAAAARFWDCARDPPLATFLPSSSVAIQSPAPFICTPLPMSCGGTGVAPRTAARGGEGAKAESSCAGRGVAASDASPRRLASWALTAPSAAPPGVGLSLAASARSAPTVSPACAPAARELELADGSTMKLPVMGVDRPLRRSEKLEARERPCA